MLEKQQYAARTSQSTKDAKPSESMPSKFTEGNKVNLRCPGQGESPPPLQSNLNLPKGGIYTLNNSGSRASLKHDENDQDPSTNSKNNTKLARTGAFYRDGKGGNHAGNLDQKLESKQQTMSPPKTKQ